MNLVTLYTDKGAAFIHPDAVLWIRPHGSELNGKCWIGLGLAGATKGSATLPPIEICGEHCAEWTEHFLRTRNETAVDKESALRSALQTLVDECENAGWKCECLPEPENAGDICPLCQAKVQLAS